MTTTAIILYIVFAAGALAVHQLMPKGGASPSRAGAVIGSLAVGGLLITLAARVVVPSGLNAYFYLFSTIAILAGARVITHPRPVYSALYFVLVVVAVSALLFLHEAEFLAIALIIVYAGAILVTYLFVIMLATQPGEPVYDVRAREPGAAALAGFVLMAAIAGKASEITAGARRAVTASSESAGSQSGDALAMGQVLMTKYVVAVEVAAVLLLISMVGAIAMSRKVVAEDPGRTARGPLGQVGREVPPY